MYETGLIAKEIEKIDISNNPSKEEPARQYWFIKQMRSLVQDIKGIINRDLTACVVTFGCQMNARDSEKISGILKLAGINLSEDENSDIVIYNTCTVRENANLKVYGRLGRLKNFKEKNPHMITVLCGCMMQEEEVVKKLKKSFSNVDIIFGTYNIYKFSELLAGKLLERYNDLKAEAASDEGYNFKHKMKIELAEGYDKIVEELPKERKYSFKSGVNIMFGCNNFCTYCIVPYVRGREISREPEDIIEEIEALAADNVKEVMLLGQNVNSYGRGLKNEISFAELLTRVCRVEGIERVRFMTSHPKDLSDELIEVMAREEKVCNYLHLPVQCGSTKLLQKMNRHYTKEDYMLLVQKIKDKIPDISLSTDIIVGFPGETEEDFEETLDVIEKSRYSSVFTFQYSKRTGTPAAKMENQIPDDVVKERFERLLALVNKITSEISLKDVGSVQKVLVEGIDSHDEKLVTGRTEKNYLVHFEGDKELIGNIVDVRLVESKGFYFLGEKI
ncbi:MAG: tRNA (N6-isopentenyl adenosine(37)-C2)-methylthiotransferase MiaB [Lachnospiraceae bacterium]|nr:tRNA (N6-isopentenyl adenosine(37)-C2)-methylthiotransferase MiaB [Lachnospiraceae bacterium]